MVKTGTIIGVAVVAVVGFLLYYFLQQGGGGTQGASQSDASQINPSATGYSTASGQGSLAVTEIYSPSYSTYNSTQETIQTHYNLQNKVGLLNL